MVDERATVGQRRRAAAERGQRRDHDPAGAATVVVPGPAWRPPSHVSRPVTLRLPRSVPARWTAVPASVSVSPSRTVRSSAISTVPGSVDRARERALRPTNDDAGERARVGLVRAVLDPQLADLAVDRAERCAAARRSSSWCPRSCGSCRGSRSARSRSSNTVAVPRRSISPRFSSTRPVVSEEMPLSTSVPVDLRGRPGRPSCRPSTPACRSRRSRRRACRPSACAATTFTVPLTVAPVMAASLVSLPPTLERPGLQRRAGELARGRVLAAAAELDALHEPVVVDGGRGRAGALVGPGDADGRAAGAVDRAAGCRACPRRAAPAPPTAPCSPCGSSCP